MRYSNGDGPTESTAIPKPKAARTAHPKGQRIVWARDIAPFLKKEGQAETEGKDKKQKCTSSFCQSLCGIFRTTKKGSEMMSVDRELLEETIAVVDCQGELLGKSLRRVNLLDGGEDVVCRMLARC